MPSREIMFRRNEMNSKNVDNISPHYQNLVIDEKVLFTKVVVYNMISTEGSVNQNAQLAGSVPPSLLSYVMHP